MIPRTNRQPTITTGFAVSEQLLSGSEAYFRSQAAGLSVLHDSISFMQSMKDRPRHRIARHAAEVARGQR
ncbi:MAG TPA: hypothetical protein VGJ19_23840 [Streptosporangiaceae bacterium]